MRFLFLSFVSGLSASSGLFSSFFFPIRMYQTEEESQVSGSGLGVPDSYSTRLPLGLAWQSL